MTANNNKDYSGTFLVILGAVTMILGLLKSRDTWVSVLCLGVRFWAQSAALRGKSEPRVALSRGQDVVVVNNRCLGVGLSLGPMDARGFGEGLCVGLHTQKE